MVVARLAKPLLNVELILFVPPPGTFTLVSRGREIMYIRSCEAGMCTMMIESVRAPLASTPTISMLIGPSMFLPWICASEPPSRLAWVTDLSSWCRPSLSAAKAPMLSTINRAPNPIITFDQIGPRGPFDLPGREPPDGGRPPPEPLRGGLPEPPRADLAEPPRAGFAAPPRAGVAAPP